MQHMEVVNFSVKARAVLAFSTEGTSEIWGTALRVRSRHLDHTLGSTHVLACMEYYISHKITNQITHKRQTLRTAYPKYYHVSLLNAEEHPAASPLLVVRADVQLSLSACPCWPLVTVITWHCCTSLISPHFTHVGITDAGGNPIPENGKIWKHLMEKKTLSCKRAFVGNKGMWSWQEYLILEEKNKTTNRFYCTLKPFDF